jgi:hypothetical protein
MDNEPLKHPAELIETYRGFVPLPLPFRPVVIAYGQAVGAVVLMDKGPAIPSCGRQISDYNYCPSQ